MLGDKVLLTPVNAGVPLHASAMELLDNPGCNEVGILSRPKCISHLSIRLLLYLHHNAISSDIVFTDTFQLLI